MFCSRRRFGIIEGPLLYEHHVEEHIKYNIPLMNLPTSQILGELVIYHSIQLKTQNLLELMTSEVKPFSHLNHQGVDLNI